jgi:hypothetical protein
VVASSRKPDATEDPKQTHGMGRMSGARALIGRPMTVVRFAAALTVSGNLAASGSMCLDRHKDSFE